MAFEIGNLAADGRQRNAETAGRGGKAAGLHRRDKERHGFETIHHFFQKMEGMIADMPSAFQEWKGLYMGFAAAQWSSHV
ncbi:hypothetical protein MesoLj131c_15810 [Mesorhizobium sp. 131-3-5]|nr:hypothetical protein MesoLj131c_15810 [Mesorhizobium sp. 131-3-5]